MDSDNPSFNAVWNRLKPETRTIIGTAIKSLLRRRGLDWNEGTLPFMSYDHVWHLLSDAETALTSRSDCPTAWGDVLKAMYECHIALHTSELRDKVRWLTAECHSKMLKM